MFLDGLDRFTGILFLTSNGYGIMDGSLYVRITTDLHLMPLSKEATRHIWRRLLRQAEEDGISCEVDGIVDHADEIFEERGWSGRQIRNIFDTAVHMAKWEHRTGDGVNLTLDVRHIKQAQGLRR